MLIWPPAKWGGDTQAEGEREANDVSLRECAMDWILEPAAYTPLGLGSRGSFHLKCFSNIIPPKT